MLSNIGKSSKRGVDVSPGRSLPEGDLFFRVQIFRDDSSVWALCKSRKEKIQSFESDLAWQFGAALEHQLEIKDLTVANVKHDREYIKQKLQMYEAEVIRLDDQIERAQKAVSLVAPQDCDSLNLQKLIRSKISQRIKKKEATLQIILAFRDICNLKTTSELLEISLCDILIEPLRKMCQDDLTNREIYATSIIDRSEIRFDKLLCFANEWVEAKIYLARHCCIHVSRKSYFHYICTDCSYTVINLPDPIPIPNINDQKEFDEWISLLQTKTKTKFG
jgi:hypothetical protein